LLSNILQVVDATPARIELPQRTMRSTKKSAMDCEWTVFSGVRAK